jgi:hypothetical protein
MSRDLERSAAEMERKAQNQALTIRRVVQEYNEFVRSGAYIEPTLQLKKQREIERVVGQYTQLHKALRRLRKKMRVGK